MTTDNISPSTRSFFITYYGIGALVVGTYVWGCLRLQNKYSDGNTVDPNQTGVTNLWGGIYQKEWLLHIYYVGFLLSTLGYLVNAPIVTHLFLTNRIPFSLGRKLVASLAVFLVSELFWMPMCVVYVGHPSEALFYAIDAQLKFSGCCSLAWAYFNSQLNLTDGNGEQQLAPLHFSNTITSRITVTEWNLKFAKYGSIALALHCFVLDGLLWPRYFHNDGRLPPPSG